VPGTGKGLRTSWGYGHTVRAIPAYAAKHTLLRDVVAAMCPAMPIKLAVFGDAGKKVNGYLYAHGQLSKMQLSGCYLLIQHGSCAFSALAEAARIFAERVASAMHQINGYGSPGSGGVGILTHGKRWIVKKQVFRVALHGSPLNGWGELTGKAPADTISIDLSLSWQQKRHRMPSCCHSCNNST
jgi:hypothetical protein